MPRLLVLLMRLNEEKGTSVKATFLKNGYPVNVRIVIDHIFLGHDTLGGISTKIV
jgi:hypothetical protein